MGGFANRTVTIKEMDMFEEDDETLLMTLSGLRCETADVAVLTQGPGGRLPL